VGDTAEHRAQPEAGHSGRRVGGAPKLTPREWEVLALAGEGLSNTSIARRLYVSPATVRKHMEHVFDHLGVRNRNEAAAVALPHRPVSPSGHLRAEWSSARDHSTHM
jgi:DNA-binding NarL/FixJ family response regulator